MLNIQGQIAVEKIIWKQKSCRAAENHEETSYTRQFFSIIEEGSIHTCDLGMNFSLSNGLYRGYIHNCYWLTFAWTEKFINGLCTPFLAIACTEKVHEIVYA